MILWHCIVLALFSGSARSAPWNAPDALASVASASSATSSDPYTNIADLRRKHEKIRRFEDEKLVVVGVEDADADAPDAGKNDVSPGDARKRLGVVLEKIRGIFDRRPREDREDEGNEIGDKEENLDGEEGGDGTKEGSNGRFGQIGVFFVELLGSIVGLAYGAVAHFNNLTAPAPDV